MATDENDGKVFAQFASFYFLDDAEVRYVRRFFEMVGGQSVMPNKQTLKFIGTGSSFLRKGFGLKSNTAKRKSAVELLQESKAFYVKSEKVLDSKQEFKHSEHLQVSSNPNIELLLKAPKNNNGPSSSTGLANGNQHHPHNSESNKPPLPPPRRSSTGGTINGNHLVLGSSNAPESKRKSVPLPLSSGIPMVNGNGPPKSPRMARPRSKTQPESVLVMNSNGKSGHPQPPVEYRRSHSESIHRQHSDDVQMKLRRLLNHADSKENLNASLSHNGEIEFPVGVLAGMVFPCTGSPSMSSPAKEGRTPPPVPSRTMPLRNVVVGDPIIKPRQQQDGNYSIHKSMPDLSPTKIGLGKNRVGKSRSSCRGTSPTPTDSSSDEGGCGGGGGCLGGSSDAASGSLSIVAQKSADLKRSHSQNTSDYVSRSPSYKGGGSGGLEEGLIQNDRDGTCLMDSTGFPNTTLLTGSPAVITACQIRRELVKTSSPPEVVRRRPILRSKSDISHRFSKCTTEFLDVGNGGGMKMDASGRNEADLERFFDMMGLESGILRLVMSPLSADSSPVFFSSSSSITSSHRGVGGGGQSQSHAGDSDNGSPIPCHTSAIANVSSSAATAAVVSSSTNENMAAGCLTNKGILQHGRTDTTSIVERNARVIKWLYNCRKAKMSEGNDSNS